MSRLNIFGILILVYGSIDFKSLLWFVKSTEVIKNKRSVYFRRNDYQMSNFVTVLVICNYGNKKYSSHCMWKANKIFIENLKRKELLFVSAKYFFFQSIFACGLKILSLINLIRIKMYIISQSFTVWL